MDNNDITLPQHEAKSEARASRLEAKIDHLKEKDDMGQPVNVFATPADGGGAALPIAAMAAMGHRGVDGGMGAGLGAGLVGGLLGGLIFGRGGFGGFGGVDGACGGARVRDCQSPEMAATTAMGLSTAIGGVAAAVAASTDKLSGGQMMLMNSTSAGFANQGQMTLQQTIMLIQQLNAQNLTVMQELCNINQNVSAQGCATRETCVAENQATRALIQSIQDANLQRELGVAQVALQDSHRRREHEQVLATITNTNTAVAAQAQGQQQQQLQAINAGLAQLFPMVQGVLQVAHATNSNVIAGNTGAVTTGAQTSTASPTTVNA